ncbi:MAG: CusA/CzcA family heavy metal efflux RND transporter [Kangiella sp.]|jgi:cobalt-zinc-cadmium resistance protein CzcA|uniref:Cytochrome C peroxidase n=3 Tax=Gammaproteobacteria TaxID=1236 RepID=A0A0F4PL17_9GAMM|nr:MULTISPECIES: CusA/CzcA family heavy metal efflux RND transporter [Gammaproteobacteria]MEC8905113.1 CusA/CzcA family heavy metal efflux RND transporter [Pseudomonadota bacterium]AXR06651.1 CusA/CzcA family heavy metal efflux RND transporter [Salinimonas sediminis]KJY95683.1 cytochrome C peroxidase [Pseudoalteromonas ruthenica]KJZ00429.1 cytochrome C peroxidase [Pseudoalteromonas ruthenica]MBD3653955.1 efflux RND transporter permease subunit [Kangiella sp.]|tara:strand:+ start:11716 stop:14910 length:3195 start_codon:yes stop_codon:yes gene_type:complete
MFNRIVDWAVTNRLLVAIALITLTVSAFFIIPRLNLDAFPDVTNVQVSVNTEAPGLAAEEVEQLITYPIEAVMYALPDVEEVRSISKTGLSGVTVVFKEGTDIYFARQLVFERLQAAKELIPEGVGTPEMGPNTSGLGQVYQYLLVAEPGSGFDAMELRSLNDWVVKLLLIPAEGVTDVLSFGGEVRQYQVDLNPSKLLSYDLTQDDIMAALERNNTNVGGWYMNRGQEQLVIRGTGWLDHGKQGLEQIRQVPLKTVDGTTITVSDVAKVNLGSEIRQGAVTMTRRTSDGKVETLGEVVSGIVLKRLGANTKSTIDGVNARIERINQALPEGVKFEAYYDQADLVTQAVDTVVNALLLAFVFIVVILALFLMNLRATLLVLISIPISIGIALMVMAWFGLSANLMSLGGIAVAIGMLVDGSVVMVENMFKHLTHPDATHDKDRQTMVQDDPDPVDAAHDSHGIALRLQEAGREVARPIFFATAIILVVFMPLFSFEGVEAKLFQPMAISIMLSMLSALVVALIIVPALATYLFRKGIRPRESFVLKPLDKLYRKGLSWAMSHSKVVVGIAVTLVVAAALVIPRLGTEFVPELEEGTVNLRVTLAPSSSLDTALEVAPKLEAMLMEFPEVTYALSRIGRAEIGGDPEPVNNIEIYIGLKPVPEWTSADNRYELQSLMEQKLEQHPGLLFNFSQPIATRVDELLSGVKAQLAIKLFGKDLDVLAEKGQAIEAVVKKIDGTRDVAMEQIVGEAQLVVKPNRRALSRYGLDVADVMEVVRNGLGGASAGQIINGNERYDIYVRLDERFRQDRETIADLRLQAPSGAWVRLGDVASVNIASGPPQVRRDDVQRRVVVQANVQGRDMGSVVADIRAAIAEQVDLPTGYSVDIGGQFENQQRAQKRLSLVVPLSLALIALLLYFAFASVGQAMLILVNVPLAVIGGVFSLWLSGQYLSVPSSVGFITLFGVAVLNGVVMVESINQRIKDGLPVSEAAFDGAVSRLRPVLMTAVTSALGLIPMLLSNGVGAEIQKPLASVIVGGLITATFLTLFVLPVLFAWFSKGKLKEKH